MRRVELAFFDAGGGHRNAALALREALERSGTPWDVQLLNVQDLLDPIDLGYQLCGVRLQDIYNTLLRRGWTLGSTALLRVAQRIIRRYHDEGVTRFAAHWRETRPDLVVSLIPNLNRALAASLRRADPLTPFVTILTDFADFPPHFWMELERQYFICGTEEAVAQAQRLGHAPERVFLTSGMILNPRFYEPATLSQAEERRRLGLDPHRPTAIVLFGGQGSTAIRQIARCLDRSRHDLQLILICGRNQSLQSDLENRTWRRPVHVEGFTSDIPRFMRLADFFIGKPGPGSLSEAFAMGLPVIVERNAWTLPQERFNTDWVRRKRVGLVVSSFSRVDEAVGQLLTGSTLETCRAAVATLRNRAVFEIPPILEKILH